MEYMEYATKLVYVAAAIPVIDLSIILWKGGREKLATSKLGNNNSLKGLTGNNGIQISKNITLNAKQSENAIVVIAPSRVGKTTSIYIPNLLQNNLKGSIIIPDPKNEIYELTHRYQESIGRKVIRYSPLFGTVNYNPLKNCKSDREVYQLAQCLLTNGSLSYEMQTGQKSGGIEWVQMCQNIFTAVLLYAKANNKSISYALELIIYHPDEEIEELLRSYPNAYKYFAAYATGINAKNTTGGVKTTLTTNLSLFLNKLNISHSDFSPEQLRNQPTALYISYPENKSNLLSPLMATFYTQFIDHLIDSYTKDSLPIWCFFDEFCNIGQLSNFPINIATAASRKISFLICLQSISQLKQIYGEHNTLTILNNCRTKVILPGISDMETLKYISELCGDKEIETQSSNDKGIARGNTTRKLFTPDEIRRLRDDELLCIINNRLPLKDNQNIYYVQDKYIKEVQQ